jgi:hypothetical protein
MNMASKSLCPLKLCMCDCITSPRIQWHLGFYQRAYTPLGRGFDEHLGYFEGTVDYYAHTGIMEQGV